MVLPTCLGRGRAASRQATAAKGHLGESTLRAHHPEECVVTGAEGDPQQALP